MTPCSILCLSLFSFLAPSREAYKRGHLEAASRRLSNAEANRRSSISCRHSPRFMPWLYSLVAGMFVIIPAFACRPLSTLELRLAAEAAEHCVRTTSYDLQNVCRPMLERILRHSIAESNRRSSISRRHSPQFVPWLYSLVAGMFVILSAFACSLSALSLPV